MMINLKGLPISHASRFYYAENCDLLINCTIYLQTVTENYLLSLINSIDFCDVSNKFLKKRVHFTYKLLAR